MKIIAGLALAGVLAALPARAQAPGPEQEVIKVWNEWKQAVIKRDAPSLRRLYADEYMSIDSEGGVWNKAEDIEIDTSGSFRLASYNLADVKVRMLGTGEVAVITGRSFFKGTGTTRREISAQYRFTDVFVKRAGRWQVVTSHLTALATLP